MIRAQTKMAVIKTRVMVEAEVTTQTVKKVTMILKKIQITIQMIKVIRTQTMKQTRKIQTKTLKKNLMNLTRKAKRKK